MQTLRQDHTTATPHSGSKVEFTAPNDTMKKKVGYGGISPMALDAAEKRLAQNNVDYGPMAQEYITQIRCILDHIKTNDVPSHMLKKDMDDMIEPVMQIKAHSGMFKFDLLGDMASSFLRFIENEAAPTIKTVELSSEYTKTMRIVVEQNIRGKGSSEFQVLYRKLDDAAHILLSKK